MLINRAYQVAGLAWLLAASALAQGTWSPVAPMLTARGSFATAKGPDGRIFVIGGDLHQGGYTPTNLMEVYDPALNAWTALPSMPTPRYSVNAAMAGGVIYVFGGYNGGPLSTVEAFTIATNTWASKASMPRARHAMETVAAPNGKIYVMGGDVQGGGENITDVDIYDPATNTWTPGPTLPATRSSSTSTFGPDGNIYLLGGGESGVPSTSVIALNLGTNVWTYRAPLSLARGNPRAAVGPDMRIYVNGGGAYGNDTAAHDAYTVDTDTWSAVTNLPSVRECHGFVAGNDGRMFLFGGYQIISDVFSVLNDAYVYLPSPEPSSQTCLLYDPSKAVKSGATIPIKLQLCDSNGGNLSSPSITLHAVSVTKVSSDIDGPVQSAGNANPDNDFRFDSGLSGGGYIFNLKTTGLSTGTYKLNFTVSGSAGIRFVNFQVK